MSPVAAETLQRPVESINAKWAEMVQAISEREVVILSLVFSVIMFLKYNLFGFIKTKRRDTRVNTPSILFEKLILI